MNAEFFALAFTSAASPSLFGIALVLIMSQRPRAMLSYIVLGGVGTAVAIGLLDVLAIRANLVKTQRELGPSAGIAIGVLLVGVGLSLRSGRPDGWRLPRHPRLPRLAPARQTEDEPGGVKRNWRERALGLQRPWLTVLVGGVLGLPGVLYLTALRNLITGSYSIANQVVAVLLFACIEFALVIVPLIALSVRPGNAAALLERWHAWLLGHGRALLAWIILAIGAYLTVSGLVGLLA